MKVLSYFFLAALTVFRLSAEPFRLFNENGKVGLKNEQGKILLPAQYDALGWSDDTFSVVNHVTGYQVDGFWGLIRIDNHRVTKPEFSNLVPGEGLFLVATKRLPLSMRTATGCINTAGKEVIPFHYEDVKISSLRAIVLTRKGNQFFYGLINLEDKKIIPLEYQDIHPIGSLRYAVRNFQNKTALFTENGKQITGFIIDSISPFKKDYAVFYQNLKQGLLDRNGQIKIDANYRTIEIQDDGTVNGRQSDEWLFLDGQNQLLKKIQGDSIVPLGKNLFKLKTAGQIQLVDQHFKDIGKTNFLSVGKFKDRKAIFSRGHKFGMIRDDGSILIEAIADQLIMDGHFLIINQRQSGKDQWSLLDTLGNQKHSKTYECIEKWNGKFFPVRNHMYWGALDENGKELIACVYDSLLQCEGKHVVVKFHRQYGVVDLKEDWIIIPQPNPVQLVNDNLFIEKVSTTTFLKSFDKKVIYFSDNVLEIKDNYLLEHLPSGALWKIDFEGRIVSREAQLDQDVEKVFAESEGLRGIKKDNKFGFIDSRGRLRIANRYDGIKSFTENLAAVKIGDKWGFLNHEDKLAIQPAYEETTSFKNGIAVVKQRGLFGVIDKNGKLILPIRYQTLEILPDHRLRIKQDGLVGLAAADGKLLLGTKYTTLEDLNNGYVIVQRDGKFSLLTLQGVSTIPMIYDYLLYDEFNAYYLALKKAGWQKIVF